MIAIYLGLVQEQVTYHQTIAPVIASKCLPCHSSTTGYAPFDFSTYESVKSRIELIRTQVLSKNMPPIWIHSDFGSLASVNSVTDEEAVQLQRWIQQKMPEGKAQSSSVPVQPTSISRTALKLSSTQSVKAEGLPFWAVTSIDLPSKGGQFTGFRLKSESSRVIRSATLAIVPKTTKLPSETAGSMDLPSRSLVGVWAPGYNSWKMPKGIVRKYEPNSKLVVQVQYRPTGKSEKAGFSIELQNQSVAKGRDSSWLTMERKEFFVPAGKSEVIELTKPLTKDLTLISILPEARFYAGQINLIYTSKNGVSKTLFETLRWDPNWIGNYMFPQPVFLAKGGTLTARFYYNNDEFCQINEGKKPKPVKAGSGAGDEVCRMHLLTSQ